MSGELLGCSGELASDLIAWHQDLDDAVVGMEPEPERSETPRRVGVWVERIEHQVYAAQKRREAARRAAGYTSWSEVAHEFEARRDELVERLRAELGSGFEVLTPPRIP
ncbi:hypothetical protein [Sporichthya sp.]|uniref:hypothetical protein n=1 Tax=Sporichthya sp. TaxID=65475 RepID=UPI0017C3A8F8|nr:hypothetical protein [Sporichthya sp.]MBA3742484.1 hypothetical protein [Sporichthya sp.]